MDNKAPSLISQDEKKRLTACYEGENRQMIQRSFRKNYFTLLGSDASSVRTDERVAMMRKLVAEPDLHIPTGLTWEDAAEPRPFISSSPTASQSYDDGSLRLRDDEIVSERSAVQAMRLVDVTKCNVTPESIYVCIRDLQDPEYANLTLEDLKVVSLEQVKVSGADTRRPHVTVRFTPTVPHCSQATVIGLSIRQKILLYMGDYLRVDVLIEPDSHVNEISINRQVNDKERTIAALENPSIKRMVSRAMKPSVSRCELIDKLADMV